MTPEACIQLGQTEAQNLTTYLEGLSPEDWVQPSACEDWEVRDVVGHLTRFMEVCKNAVSRGIQGDVSTPEGSPAPGSLNPTLLGERIAQTTIAYREGLGEKLFPAFKTSNAELDNLLETVGPNDLEKMCYHPAGLRPVRAWIDSRATELAMHAWDIRAPHDNSTHLSAQSLPLFMERILPLVSFQSGAKLPAPIRYRFNLTGDDPNQYDIVIEGDSARMESGGASEANVTLRCNTETFVLLMYQRLELEKAVASGLMTVEGDPALASGFEHWFTGF